MPLYKGGETPNETAMKKGKEYDINGEEGQIEVEEGEEVSSSAHPKEEEIRNNVQSVLSASNNNNK
jgi:hypothetical protein